MILVCLINLGFGIQLYSNNKIIDEVVAVVGNEPIFLSEVERRVIQYKAQNPQANENNLKCQLLEQLLKQKLYLNKAEQDTIEATPGRVNQALNQRLNHIIRQMGSQEQLERFYDKSLTEIQEDLREKIRDQLVMRQVQNNIIGEIEVSPEEVKKYYNALPEDSIPMVPKKYKLQEIVISPSYSEKAQLRARQRLLELRKRIMEGEDFSTLAIMYSDDQQSAQNSGELGMHTKDELPSKMAEAAFKLNEGEVSNIIHTKYGYHIIKLTNREGDRANISHILKKPEIAGSERQKTIEQLKHIKFLIQNDSLPFSQAAEKFSNEESSKMNNGVMVNPQNATTKFQLEQLPPQERYTIQNLDKGEISDPFKTQDRQGQTVYKIFRIKEIYPKHKANFESDYHQIYEMAKQHKRQKQLNKWMQEQQEDTYIHIKDHFNTCNFELSGWK